MISISGNGWILEGLQGFLFDKDGTLADLHLYWGEIIRRRARALVNRFDLGDELFPTVCRALGLAPGEERLLPEGPTGLHSRAEIIRRMCAALSSRGVRLPEDEVAEEFVRVHEAFLPAISAYVRIVPGVRPFLESLRRAGARAAVVTSDTVANTRAALALMGIEGYFAAVVGSDSIPESKVSGLPAVLALEQLGLPGQAAVCVGDSPMDVEMSVRGACRAAVAVATGQVPVETLRKHTPYAVRSLSELVVAG